MSDPARAFGLGVRFTLLSALLLSGGGCEPSVHPPREADSEHRLERRQVHTKDVPLDLIDWGGKGPNLVLLHGAGTSPRYFDGLAATLGSSFRVVAYARRGHGRSGIPDGGFDLDVITEDLRIVLDSMGIERASLLGHSFAGGEVTRFAALYPERVDAVVYLDAHYERYDSPWADLDEGRPVEPCYEPQTETIDEFRSCLRTYSIPGVEWSQGWEGLIQDMILDDDGPGIRFKSDSIVGFGSMPAINAGYRREYERIKAPVLVLFADRFYLESTTDPEWNQQARDWHARGFGAARDWTRRRFETAIPGVVIETLPGTGHFNIVTHERLPEILKEFLLGQAGS